MPHKGDRPSYPGKPGHPGRKPKPPKKQKPRTYEDWAVMPKAIEASFRLGGWYGNQKGGE